MERKILFSPPNITQNEIDEVVDTLKSGWITTGPKTKLFEKNLTEYCQSSKTVCLNSATAGMEMILRLFDVGPGDEVITSAYTYTSTASVILHCGATPVLVDIKPGSFNINPEKVEMAITEKTKAIMPVDIAGMPADYNEIFDIIESKTQLFKPTKQSLQEILGRIVVIADGAHSLGATYNGKKSGNIADFTAFSFHAVKNLTTAEGGAVTWKKNEKFSDEKLYRDLMLLCLHGQTKDALAKTKSGGWEYDIAIPGWKHNMADLNAAIGISQLKRYDKEILGGRKKLTERYFENFLDYERLILPTLCTSDRESSYHLFQLRIEGIKEEKRNKLILTLAEQGIPTNVHYKPLPLFTAYSNLGFKINNYPIAVTTYENEITLPLHNLLSVEDIDFISEKVIQAIN